jgi:hypothetical protein
MNCGSATSAGASSAEITSAATTSVEADASAGGSEAGGSEAGAERLHVPDWVDDVPTLLAAADVVVNNSGGATAQEALACGRTLVIYQPLPGHGRDSARLLSAAGLARTCRRPRDLTALLRSWIVDPAALSAAHARAARWSQDHARVDLAAVLGLPAAAPEPAQPAAPTEPSRDGDDEIPPRLVGSLR